MRIAMIEDVFHPEAGYQFNILSRYLSSFGHEVIVITTNTSKIPEKYKSFFDYNNIKEKDTGFFDRYGVQIIRVPIRCFVSGRAIYKNIVFDTVDKLKPDVLFVSGNDTYIGIRYIKKQKKLAYPVVSDNHMVEMASKNKLNGLFRLCYKYLVTPTIKKHNTRIIRTVDVDYVNKHYGIPSELTPLIGFGSDTKLFHIDDARRKEFREQLNISNDDFVCAYAGKLDESKGGLFFAEAIEKRIPVNNTVVFLIVGNTNGEYGKKTERLFSKSQNKIIRFPTQKYIDLPQFFQAANITVYPRQCSLSFFDSTACGAPALVEDNEIGIQRSQETGCLLFKAGDVDDFREKIIQYINLSPEEYESIRGKGVSYVSNNYNYEQQALKYEKVLVDAVSAYKRSH